jgi:hypothetical protein
MRRFIATAASGCFLLAACDQNSRSSDVIIKGQNGSVTVLGNGGHFTMQASEGKQSVEINTNGSTANLNLPGFVSVYPGAKVQSTTVASGANGAGGAMAFETTDSPAAVIAFYKQKSAGAGLSPAMNMNSGTTTMFVANADQGKKSLQLIAEAAGSGAHVQVNWSGGK